MNSKKYSANELIEFLHLEPLPIEGGYYRRTYTTEEILSFDSPDQTGPITRKCASTIYFLLTDEDEGFSALHQLKSDEIYHYYFGDPVEMLLLNPDGSTMKYILGQDIMNNQHVQLLVPKGVWQGSRLCPGGKVALLGTMMSPGYEQDDFLLGDRESLTRQYPIVAKDIARFTRSPE